ncbi:hypothetical protein LP123_09660 [Moraxella bovis]|uniref:hypothetical protein n=1 Tax=Moraxella bovis TaxID=476 RepID=UPI002225C941|nr:hypothetical protein [Moraxella bovis]UZA07080.1 hypothetical protein LP099_04635 [Moraxella bovis]UZA10689.1 hypothetical protein LP123_09660 [Moraxella bovis]
MAFFTGRKTAFKKAFAMMSSWERLGFLRFVVDDADCSAWFDTVGVIGSVMVLLLSKFSVTLSLNSMIISR